MAHIKVSNVDLSFPILGASAQSLKQLVLNQTTGGRVAPGAGEKVIVEALKDINIELNSGDRLGLIGHNGAGKSTLLRVLAGIYMPDRGHVEISGHVGCLIDQMAGIDLEQSGLRNTYLRGYLLGLTKTQISEMIEDVAEFTGLGDFFHLPVKTYSAGMLSRLAFAISTSIAPKILIVDEGIGAGDQDFQIAAKKRVDSLYDGVEILVIASHDENLINGLCTKKCELSHGSIKEITHVS
ncbi:MAG: ABC transporter ATP-binding protein [Lentilitoribacter sp.]